MSLVLDAVLPWMARRRDPSGGRQILGIAWMAGGDAFHLDYGLKAGRRRVSATWGARRRRAHCVVRPSSDPRRGRKTHRCGCRPAAATLLVSRVNPNTSRDSPKGSLLQGPRSAALVQPIEKRLGGEGLGTEDASAGPCFGGDELEGHDGVDGRLPHDRL